MPSENSSTGLFAHRTFHPLHATCLSMSHRVEQRLGLSSRRCSRMAAMRERFLLPPPYSAAAGTPDQRPALDEFWPTLPAHGTWASHDDVCILAAHKRSTLNNTHASVSYRGTKCSSISPSQSKRGIALRASLGNRRVILSERFNT